MRMSTYGQFGGGFGQVAGENRTDAIRKRKEKLEEEKKKGESQAKPQATPEEKEPKLNKKGKPKKNKKKSPSTPDEIRAKNEDKQHKFDEKQALKKDIKSAKEEGKKQKDARKAEKKAQKAADAEVKEQKDLATRSVTERPPAGYQDASNPDAAPTMINGRRMMRDEANMQYIDVDTGERFPFGPNETAAMKTIINRRVQRKAAGAINQERVGSDGKIRMDQDDAALLAKARKADMQAGYTNTRGATPEQGDNGEAPQRWQQNGAMGPQPVGDSFPDSLNDMSTSQMQKVSDLIGRRAKGPDGQWYTIKNQQQAIDFLNGRGNQPTGDLTDDTTAEEKPGPDQQDVMPPVDDPMGAPPAQRDAPNRVNPDSFEDPKGEFSDSPFPHFKRAPEGNAVGGTRFKDLEEFLEWERKEKRRMRMRPFGGAQAEWDALRSGPGPLYSEKSDMERWKEREVPFQPPKEVTASDIVGKREDLDISLEDRIEENLRNGLIDSKEAKRLKGMAKRNPDKAAEELSKQNRERVQGKISERKYGNSGGMFSVPSEQQPSRSEMLGEMLQADANKNPNSKMGPDIELGPSREARGLQMDDDIIVPTGNNVGDAEAERGMSEDKPRFDVNDDGKRAFEAEYPKGEDFILTQENFDEVARLNGMGLLSNPDYIREMGYTKQQVAQLQQQLAEKEVARRNNRRIAATTLDNLYSYYSNATITVEDADGNPVELPGFVDPEGNNEIHFEEIVDSMAQQQRELGMEVDAAGIAEDEAARILASTIPQNVPYKNLPTFYKEAIQSLTAQFMNKWYKRMADLTDQRMGAVQAIPNESGDVPTTPDVMRMDDPKIFEALKENWYEWTNGLNIPYSDQMQDSFEDIMAPYLDNRPKPEPEAPAQLQHHR